MLLEIIRENESHECDELRILEPTFNTCKTRCELFQFFLFMIWDGMGFFSVKGYHKLKRMKKPHRRNKCYDRYKTPENVTWGLVYLVSIILVVIFEVSKYGTIL